MNIRTNTYRINNVLWTTLVLAALLTLAITPGTVVAQASADSLVVNNLDDSGVGSLRQAIQDANATAGADTITFSVSGTITLASTLPLIIDTAGLTIDGSGQNITISGNNSVRVMTVEHRAVLTLKNLTITRGFDPIWGAGIFNWLGTVNIMNSTFSSNSGSGILSVGVVDGPTSLGAVNVTNSTFSDNRGSSLHGFSFGGGIINSGGTLNVTNSTFSGNSAILAGGAINSTGALTVENSTFSGNSASVGGAISNSGSFTLKNTIIANSPSGGNCDGLITDGGGNLSHPDTTCPGINTDPKLLALADNGGPTQTIALEAGSGAIDAGVSCPPPATDQRGVSRPQGPACDIGAYEAEVSYSFTGFFSPVDNLPTLNTVKAGQSIPVKFSLDGDQGLDILAAGYPKVQQIACDSAAPGDAIEETLTSGTSGLQYDPAMDTYTYVWKTQKSWARTCRQLIIRLADGTDHIASFQFK